jgi:hypothetical protein
LEELVEPIQEVAEIENGRSSNPFNWNCKKRFVLFYLFSLIANAHALLRVSKFT